MENYNSEKVGLELKRLRQEHSFTQEQIAEGLDCTVAFVSNIENNRAKLNLRVLMYYAKVCNVSVDSILNAGQENYTTKNSTLLDQKLLHIFHQFTEAEQQKIIKILQLIKF